MTATLLLAELGQRIVDDGPAAHHLLLQHLGALVAAATPGAAAALADATAPDVVRQRAFAVVSAALLRQPNNSGLDTANSLGLAA